jgi:tRNA(Ile)-lysidine synthase TilS/MesJ
VLRDEDQVQPLLRKIKKSGQNSCIVGISGGLDSSYLLYRAVKTGLNPVAVHIDTGWDTETSASNIEKITKPAPIPQQLH